MGFKRKIKYFLVHSLSFTNKEAQDLINEGRVEIEGKVIIENCELEDNSEIKLNGIIKREKKELVYLKFNKPKGFESTLNKTVPDNLSSFFKKYENLAIAGRLDKQSEGLLLLSNDGKWVEKICNPKFEKEKEYEVLLNKQPDEHFLHHFRSGVTIGDYKTAECKCNVINGLLLRITLKEGKNRQIRHMCKALGYRVLELKRIRMHNIELSELQTSEVKHISKEII